MKLTLHIARLRNGLQDKLIVDTDLDRLYADLAKDCRKQWSNHDWGMDAEGHNENPMPIPPQTDKEVVEMFYHDDLGTPEGPCIHWAEAELDIGARYDEAIKIGPVWVQRTKGRFTPTLYTGDGANIDGTLIGDMPDHSDALESLILALTAAGFPVHLPEFAEAVQAAVDGCANNADHTMEDNERRMAVFGWSIDLDRVTEQWAITKEGENSRRVDVSTERYETRRNAVEHAMRLMGRKESE